MEQKTEGGKKMNVSETHFDFWELDQNFQWRIFPLLASTRKWDLENHITCHKGKYKSRNIGCRAPILGLNKGKKKSNFSFAPDMGCCQNVSNR